MNTSINDNASTFRGQKLLSIAALIFGGLTLFSAGLVLFGPKASNTWAGDYVGFVVWFNFFAGAAYIVAAIGLWQAKPWTVYLAALIAISTAGVALGFLYIVLRGSPFEMRTVGALIVRFGFWAGITILAARGLKPR